MVKNVKLTFSLGSTLTWTITQMCMVHIEWKHFASDVKFSIMSDHLKHLQVHEKK